MVRDVLVGRSLAQAGVESKGRRLRKEETMEKSVRGFVVGGLRGLAIMALLVVGTPGVGYTADGLLTQANISAAATMDVYSRYVWRGFTLDTDAVVQPGFSVSGYGLTVSYWGSFDADNNDLLASDESDFIIDYTFALESVSFSLGNTWYDFPGANTYSSEWYVGAGFPKLFLAPVLKYYYDYGDQDHGGGDGQYIWAGISHSLSLVEEQGISLDLAASVGFNRELYIRGDGGDYGLSAGIGIPLTATLKLTPKIGYAIPFGDLKAADDGNQKSRFYSGISIGGSF